MEGKTEIFSGKDLSGNDSFISISFDGNKVEVFSPEDASEVYLDKKIAKKLADFILSICK